MKKSKLIPRYYCDLFGIHQYCFSQCPKRNGHIDFKKFLKACKDKDFIISRTYLCCLWLMLFDNGETAFESNEGIKDCNIGFNKMNEKGYEAIIDRLSKMTLVDQAHFLQDRIALIEGTK